LLQGLRRPRAGHHAIYRSLALKPFKAHILDLGAVLDQYVSRKAAVDLQLGDWNKSAFSASRMAHLSSLLLWFSRQV